MNCLVCGDGIQEGNRVQCRGCDTPHHRDCFEYTGKCAVYACGSRTYSLSWQRESTRASRSAIRILDRLPATRVLVASAPELHIEAAGAMRSLGVFSMGSGAAAASFFTPAAAAGGASASASASASTTSNPLWGLEAIQFLFELVGNFFLCGELGLVLLAILVVPLAFWLLLGVLLPLLLGVAGWLAFQCHGSTYVLDNVQQQLHLRCRFLGLPYWGRTWKVDDMTGVILETAGEGRPHHLGIELVCGKRLWLADDRHHRDFGYTASDLDRLGRRLSEATGLPYLDGSGEIRLPEPPAR